MDIKLVKSINVAVYGVIKVLPELILFFGSLFLLFSIIILNNLYASKYLCFNFSNFLKKFDKMVFLSFLDLLKCILLPKKTDY